MNSSKRKVAMVDFWSVADDNGKPLGHGGKVGNEYYKYVEGKFDITQYVNQTMLPFIMCPDKEALSPSISNGERKASRVLKHFMALRNACNNDADIIWFYVPDIYLFIFLLFFNKRNKRIAVNVYEEYQTNKIKCRIFKRALRKIDVVFVTNEMLLKDIPQGILIPDYTYDEEEYDGFRTAHKIERAVCLGTMNEKKKLRESVETFSKNGYPLYIAGQFADKGMYEDLIAIKGDNIKIEDRYVDSIEYYELLGSSRYCLIPYDAEFYKNRTSGVIQESLFCDTIPISHKEILEFSGIPGVGYKDISELGNYDFSAVGSERYLNLYSEIRRNKYLRSKVVDTVERALDNC
jgi:hypothetical protein